MPILAPAMISALAAVLEAHQPEVPPRALPQRATEDDLKWQPSLDYDQDSCYNVPAIDSNGQVSNGLPHEFSGPTDDCRDAKDLDNSNAYSRRRCNNGVCVYLYDYYFEKDVAVHVLHLLNGGHRYEWEHIAVWAKHDRATHVAVSAHGNYHIRPADEMRWEGTHPKVVYHRDGASTHCFRFAEAQDDHPVENHKGTWIRSPLVSWDGFPPGIRETLVSHDWGKGNIAIKDENFSRDIELARPAEFEEAFDSHRDDNSPGTPW